MPEAGHRHVLDGAGFAVSRPDFDPLRAGRQSASGGFNVAAAGFDFAFD